VRCFDAALPPSAVSAYVDLIRAIHSWIDERPELAYQVQLELPVEVGADFVARPHHVYQVSTAAYVEWEDPPELPDELVELRQELRACLAEVGDDPHERIVARVIVRSMLEPTGKAYFAESTGQLVVVEPKLTPEDVEAWARLERERNDRA